MPKILAILFFCCLTTVIVYAQSVTRAYPSAQSILEDKPDTIENIEITIRTKGEKQWKGKNDFKISGDNRFKSRYIIIERNDSTFVNCDMLIKQQGYALAYFRSKKFIYFLASRSKVVPGIHPYTNRNGATLGYALGGIPGLILATKNDRANLERFEYLYDVQNDEVVAFNSPVKRRYIRESISPEDAAFVAFAKELLRSAEEAEKKEFAEREY